MEKREIKMGSVQAFLILRSIISVSPGIAGRRTDAAPDRPDRLCRIQSRLDWRRLCPLNYGKGC